MRKERSIVILFPFLTVNTTSVNRFNSLIDNCITTSKDVQVIHLIFPGEPLPTGVFRRNDNPSLHFSVTRVNPELNLLQKAAVSFQIGGKQKLASILRMVHGFLYRTDVFYSKPYKILNAIRRPFNGGLIITSGGPFSNFQIAIYLAKRTQSKLVLDYRDPWSYGYKYLDTALSSKFRQLFFRHQELRYLKHASLITTVSQTLKNQFPEKFHHKIHVIPNGANFEPALAEINPKPEIFTIFYAGTIYNDQIADETFFKALQLFIKGKDQQKIKLVFAGASKNKTLPKTLFKHELLEIAEILPRLENEEVKPYFANASLFLHLRYGNRSGIITSKQADYLAWRKPILLPVSDNGDLAESITMHNAGYVCNGVAESLAVLEQLWEKFLNKVDIIIDQEEEFLRKNTRTYWAEEFVKLVEQL